MLKRSWVEINLKILETNYKIYESLIPYHQQIMAVVKADAYGHGDKMITERLANIGCRSFAVSNAEEAVLVRKAGAEGQILVLGYTPADFIPQLLEYDITQALLSEEYAEYFAAAMQDRGLNAKDLKTQFAIDTGMNRIGLDADDEISCERVIRKYTEVFNMTGIFTHLAAADTISLREFTNRQISKFRCIVNRVDDLELPYYHCMNTAGGMFCTPYGNLVRLGIAMYGLKPDYENQLPRGIKPVLTWKSVISQIKTVHAGESIGYGCSFTADKDLRVATIPTGYADGYSRMLSGCGLVMVHGKPAPILGRVCMDQMMIDVSDIPEAKFEDEVILLGENYTADDMAHCIGTIGYEIVCSISKRVPRIYV